MLAALICFFCRARIGHKQVSRRERATAPVAAGTFALLRKPKFWFGQASRFRHSHSRFGTSEASESPFARRNYDVPESTIGKVGVAAPGSFSTVTANPLAGTARANGADTSVALPCASGLKVPAGIGCAPLAGNNHSSYTLCGGKGLKLLARSTRLRCGKEYTAFASGCGLVPAATSVMCCASFALNIRIRLRASRAASLVLSSSAVSSWFTCKAARLRIQSTATATASIAAANAGAQNHPGLNRDAEAERSSRVVGRISSFRRLAASRSRKRAGGAAGSTAMAI